ncbi:MAG: bifunctional glycosyltransferase family 2 protein/CDP-glycerol:glycerophosphate glycerophosphotransferase [Lachnospiraceae bacterium]|jgi:CDP-glycerol glycerophosphotransferase (TagB/SpsB family)/glycosyltransferase involved in cell wall biosynthesis|nr:bifunctional glycosyltransferase family 2 protein/CDP-glycerol:glycerophosphate glycerophosphotransferase [Lachnospiraceae bacterium]
MQEYDFKFSVVMAVYNVEKYLDEAVESLVNQTIGFEENIQLIMVDDGSVDSSGMIADKWQKKYPNNIIVIHKENGGVSSARNEGIKYIEGKFVNFLDSDDKWEEEAFEKVWKFHEVNPKIQLIKGELVFFEGKNGGHPLNYVLNETKIISIDEEPNMIFQSLSSGFIEANLLDINSFPTKMPISEDSYFINEIIVKIKEFGVINSLIYYYRRRNDNSSAIQNSSENHKLYNYKVKKLMLDPINNFFVPRYGSLHPWIQNVFLYDLSWIIKMKETPIPLKDKGQFDDYIDSIYKVLQYIDDELILKTSKWLNTYQRHALIHLKYRNALPVNNNYYQMNVLENDIQLIDDNNNVMQKFSELRVVLKGIFNDENKLELFGFCGGMFPYDNFSAFIRNEEGKVISLDNQRFVYNSVYFIGKKIHEPYGWRVEIPWDFINKSKRIYFIAKIGNIEVKKRLISEGNSVKLNTHSTGQYMEMRNKLIYYNLKKRCFIIQNNTLKHKLFLELTFYKYLKGSKNWKRIILVRLLSILINKIKKDKIVNIFTDRVDKADDNAEVLYRYYEQNREKNEINYFVINKKTKDYKRLKKEGFNVVKMNSVKYLFKMLQANNMITSHAERYLWSPFYWIFDNKINDKFKYKFIFLQHGIIKENLSSWLHRDVQNFQMFVTSSKTEYNSIVNPQMGYGYSDKEVKLIGLPRYDRLLASNSELKYIAVMPTWRSELAGKLNKNGIREKNSGFKETEYYQNWNTILNSEELKRLLKISNKKILFVPHPNLRIQVDDFEIDPKFVEISEYSDRYVDIINKSCAMITDTSSVFFDFGYMYKPIYYYQYDEGNWGKGKNNYFDYQSMGFGPVSTTLNDLIRNITIGVERNFVMRDEYKNRVNNYYEFHDQNNCKRNKEAIEGLYL